ncbi:hypothetical protein SAMN02745116_00536 [Pilibacter termitis]|uniref:Uncharacterized protein n=1 Tax=Pilibacter termitis TaxID=263852 RepID=A0A1T4L4A9_9ENTE|nr:hypothetical protein [Pilibacter termitis]SJZ49544.1 hypothetical protein SAMN02745116_00536 [Pilibacter termitis]
MNMTKNTLEHFLLSEEKHFLGVEVEKVSEEEIKGVSELVEGELKKKHEELMELVERENELEEKTRLKQALLEQQMELLEQEQERIEKEFKHEITNLNNLRELRQEDLDYFSTLKLGIKLGERLARVKSVNG